MSIEALRNEARHALHDTLSVPAKLFLKADLATAYDITVRRHTKPGTVGDLAGTNLNYAETHDEEEKLVFLVEEFADIAGAPGRPTRGSLVVVSATEGYWVENVLPPHGITVKAEVVRANEADLAGKETP
tara:strand:- start:16189 stop:16578 length:390 start_codon:yes stop_codon:yes gene_type:complete